MNSPALNPLCPDHEGHYSRLAQEVDRSSRAAFAPGKHPIDAMSGIMADRKRAAGSLRAERRGWVH